MLIALANRARSAPFGAGDSTAPGTTSISGHDDITSPGLSADIVSAATHAMVQRPVAVKTSGVSTSTQGKFQGQLNAEVIGNITLYCGQGGLLVVHTLTSSGGISVDFEHILECD